MWDNWLAFMCPMCGWILKFKKDHYDHPHHPHCYMCHSDVDPIPPTEGVMKDYLPLK